MIEIREATEHDVGGIRDLFLAAYGKHYTYPQYYDRHVLKKMVFDDDTLLLVAEDQESEQILGTASVLFDKGAFGDLLGEFGRLVVHPDGRRRGIGKKLMDERIAHSERRLHLGMVENRVAHPFSQRISARYGFTSAGFLPLKARFDERESLALYIRHFGDALRLRRNNPHIIPEGFQLAQHVLESCGLDPDVIIDDISQAYPDEHSFEIEDMETKGYASLLRFERARAHQKEVFGQARILQGLFLLEATNSHYVIARKDGKLVGAIGYSVDMMEKALKIFEIVTVDRRPIRVMIEEVIKRGKEKFDMAYIEVDISGYSPSMQRTFLELQFVPVAYMPSFAFQGAERYDVMRMARLFVPAEIDSAVLHHRTQPVFDIVKSNFSTRDLLPRLGDVLPQIRLFNGFTREQVRRITEVCELTVFQKNEVVVEKGEESENAYIVLRGSLTVSAGDPASLTEVGMVREGECFGETVILDRKAHSVTATAFEKTEAAIINRNELAALIRRRPDIGVVVYRNLASSLARKLRGTDTELAQGSP